MTIRAQVVGVGSYLPDRVMTNDDIAKMVDTSHEWILERTGISERRIVAEGQLTSHIGVRAAQEALANANLTPDDIDLIILATTTPDMTMPSTATKIQYMLGMKHGAAFDIAAACSGFVYGLATADSFIRTGLARRAIVIGAETYSRLLDWKDRSTCILFGDGAGAVILETAEADGTVQDRGVLYSKLYSDGQYAGILNTTGGISWTQTAGTVTMAGKEVFRHAVAKMADCVVEGLETLGLKVQDIDWLVPHQANIRILNAMADRLGLPVEKVIATVGQHANTSAASIPLALADATRAGKLAFGQMIAIPALGAGLTWGVCLIRW